MKQVAWLPILALVVNSVTADDAIYHGNEKSCSTWGRGHVRTLDDELYSFMSNCRLLLASNCRADFEDTSVFVERNSSGHLIEIDVKLLPTTVKINNFGVFIDGVSVGLPYSNPAFGIKKHGFATRLRAKLSGITVIWGEDFATILIGNKYKNTMCGLCGNFNGVKDLPLNNTIEMERHLNLYEESHNCSLKSVPSPDCSVVSTATAKLELQSSTIIMNQQANCLALGMAQYASLTTWDACACETMGSECFCATISEAIRHCALLNGRPKNWRMPDICGVTCPGNMEYKECGSPCLRTCGNPIGELVCEEPCMVGCFCPEDTLLRHDGQCVAIPQCSCSHNNQIYAAGEQRNDGVQHW
uniref:mucin-6-like n=1 Tax=Myxine glutinosa TaxID=7769 RepID=UPI00358E745F